MPEVLGATAVILTVATIATLSVKDTVQASSQAAMQRELQQLNTALNNYDAAGGVIPGTADDNVQEAIDALKGGVGLAGSGDFTPLVEDPSLTVSLNGEDYNLDYDPQGGFSYIPASGDGNSISGAGGNIPASGASGSPFDFTNDAATSDAIAALGTLPYGDPERAGILEGLNAARDGGYLNDQEENQLADVIAGDGFIFDVNGRLVESPFDYTNQVETQAALQDLILGTPATGTPEYVAALIALDNGATENPGLASDIDSALTAEYVKAVGSGSDQGVTWDNLIGGLGVQIIGEKNGMRIFYGAVGVPVSPPPISYGLPFPRGIETTPAPVSLPLNLSDMGTGLEWKEFNARDLSGHNFSGAKFTWSNLAGATLPADLTNAWLWHANLSGVDLSNADLNGTSLQASNLTGATLPTNLAGAKLDGAYGITGDWSNSNLTGTSLQKVDLTGVTLPADLRNVFIPQTNLSGKDLSNTLLPKTLLYVNLAGATLPTNLVGFNFIGTNLTDVDLSSANLSDANLSLLTTRSGYRSFTGVTLPNSLSGVNFTRANLTGLNLSAVNLVGASLDTSNLVWTVLPSNLSGVNMRCTDLSGRNFSSHNLSGANLLNSNVNYATFTGARVSSDTVAPDNTRATLDAGGNGTWFGKTVTGWIVQ